MWQGAVKRLCNPSESCHVRKVARLLAQALKCRLFFKCFPRREQKNILSIVKLYLFVTPYFSSQTVDRYITLTVKEPYPILWPLFIDMMFSSLVGNSGRKKHYGSEPC